MHTVGLQETGTPVSQEIDEHRPSSAFAKLIDRLAIYSGYIAGIAVLLICLLVLAEVGSRTLFNRSTLIADEICGYLNVVVVFFGLVFTLKNEGFIRVEALYRRFRGRVKRTADLYNLAASLIYFIVLLAYMTKYVWYSYINNMISENYLEVPLYIPEIVILIGLVLAILYLISSIILLIREEK